MAIGLRVKVVETYRRGFLMAVFVRFWLMLIVVLAVVTAALRSTCVLSGPVHLTIPLLLDMGWPRVLLLLLLLLLRLRILGLCGLGLRLGRARGVSTHRTSQSTRGSRCGGRRCEAEVCCTAGAGALSTDVLQMGQVC
jgi:hypothetical protein